jgi:hypothetical protein
MQHQNSPLRNGHPQTKLRASAIHLLRDFGVGNGREKDTASGRPLWSERQQDYSIQTTNFICAYFVTQNSLLVVHFDVSYRRLFNWLWPSLVQERLDEFREYWNNHRLSSQKHKLLPAGTSPRQIWLVPDAVRATARNCSIHVNMGLVHQLREELGGIDGREEAFRFVDAEFAAEADEALAQLGYPDITLSSAWDVFVAVNDILSGDYA